MCLKNMPAYTYQIAIREYDDWERAYVAAPDRAAALATFMQTHPEYDADRLMNADVEVEPCQ